MCAITENYFEGKISCVDMAVSILRIYREIAGHSKRYFTNATEALAASEKFDTEMCRSIQERLFADKTANRSSRA